MHRKGISTSRARHEERQPLIDCAIKITQLQNYLFFQERRICFLLLYYFYLFNIFF